MAVVLPQFIAAPTNSYTSQMVILAFEFCVIGIISDSTWVLIAAKAKVWFAKTPLRLEYLVGFGGVVIIILGFVLLSFVPKSL